MKIELHCHTPYSDGSESIDKLLEMADKEAIQYFAITDHDTTKGIKSAQEKGKKWGIDIIPGIEISAYDYKRKRKVHILGYFIEPDHPSLQQLCQHLISSRHQSSLMSIEKLKKAGYPISLEKVKKYVANDGTGIYKQHIMHALVEMGYASSIFGKEYKKLFSSGNNGKQAGIAYHDTEYAEPVSSIQTILEAGGVSVLAHPGQYDSFDLIPELVNNGLQGIEIYHPLHCFEDEKRAREFAQRYGLIGTGGSDFHGIYGEKKVVLGCNSPEKKIINQLKNRIPKK